MTKSRVAKRSSEKVSLEVLEKEIKSQLLGPQKEESRLETFWRETSKKECSEKMRKGSATNVADITLVLVPRTANGENQWHTKNPRNVL